MTSNMQYLFDNMSQQRDLKFCEFTWKQRYLHFPVLINSQLLTRIKNVWIPLYDKPEYYHMRNSHFRTFFRTKNDIRNVDETEYLFFPQSRVARIYNVVASTKYFSSMIFILSLKYFYKNVAHTSKSIEREKNSKIRKCIAQKLKLYSLSCCNWRWELRLPLRW